MTPVRPLLLVFIFVSLCGAPCRAQWTEGQREWALGTSAVLTQLNGERYDLLAAADDPEGLAHIKSVLEDPDTWNINSRQDLGYTIRNLLIDADTTGKIAWNYPRVVSLARWGYAVGHISEEEAWSVIMPTAERLQHTFGSWQELGRAYVDARSAFYKGAQSYRRTGEWAYRTILLDPTSPWRKYAWDLDLGGDPVTVKPAKSAQLILAVHVGGLMCAQLRIPDHITAVDHSYEPYLTAIEEAVACKPRVKDAHYDSKDWVLDTECTNEEVLRGAEVIALLHLEPIAVPLRREGITEMFTYVQHEPLGTSALTPAAQDAYVDGALQWHASTLSLSEVLPDVTLTYGTPPDTTDRTRIASR